MVRADGTAGRARFSLPIIDLSRHACASDRALSDVEGSRPSGFSPGLRDAEGGISHIAVEGSRSGAQDHGALRSNEIPRLSTRHVLGRWPNLAECPCRRSRGDEEHENTFHTELANRCRNARKRAWACVVPAEAMHWCGQDQGSSKRTSVAGAGPSACRCPSGDERSALTPASILLRQVPISHRYPDISDPSRLIREPLFYDGDPAAAALARLRSWQTIESRERVKP